MKFLKKMLDQSINRLSDKHKEVLLLSFHRQDTQTQNVFQAPLYVK